MSKFTSSLWKEYSKSGYEKRTDTLVSKSFLFLFSCPASFLDEFFSETKGVQEVSGRSSLTHEAGPGNQHVGFIDEPPDLDAPCFEEEGGEPL